MKKKKIEKGGIVVEGTAGNTGIGLAVVCKEFGLSLKIVIPKTQSIEKKNTLKKLGADLIEVDAVPYSNPNNYIKQSKKIAEDLSKKHKFGVIVAVFAIRGGTSITLKVATSYIEAEFCPGGVVLRYSTESTSKTLNVPANKPVNGLVVPVP